MLMMVIMMADDCDGNVDFGNISGGDYVLF